MSKRLGFGRIWDKLVQRYPMLYIVRKALGKPYEKRKTKPQLPKRR